MNWKLWIAQGFGIGRIPVAPGTFGSLLGLGFFALLVSFHSLIILLVGIVASAAVSVWLCGEAERMLGKTDPGSVVLDEIVAMPLCFLAWVIWLDRGYIPGPEYFFGSDRWLMTAGVFVLFRLFDVWKPPPVRGSQKLRGGWGVTCDDLLAALYVNLSMIAITHTYLAFGQH